MHWQTVSRTPGDWPCICFAGRVAVVRPMHFGITSDADPASAALIAVRSMPRVRVCGSCLLTHVVLTSIAPVVFDHPYNGKRIATSGNLHPLFFCIRRCIVQLCHTLSGTRIFFFQNSADLCQGIAVAPNPSNIESPPLTCVGSKLTFAVG